MSQTNTARYKYNPNEMSEDEFLKRFVVRKEVFDEVFEALQDADYSVPNQHHILVGQRGQGKTTILRKLSIEILKDKKFSKFLIPVQFSEEQYSMRGLCSLWERVAEHLEDHYEEIFEDALENVEMHEDDDNYEIKCFSYLEKQLKKHKKKLVLFIDNINILLESLQEQEQHHLREILLTSSSFIIVGGSTKMFEQQYEYSKPFYEFFNIITLEGLTFDESIALLKILGDKEQTKKIEEIIKHNPARIETLRRVTGGVPRTMVMLFDIFVEENGNTFNDLMKVLDDVTPLYQERMNHIPKVLQNITHAIAMNWDGMLTKDIAKKTKLESKVVSAQLKQLEKYHIVESVSIGKNNIYSIKERFFNIWYLMRFGKKKDRNRVEWLIQFLLAWYSKGELEDKAKSFINRIQIEEVDANYAYIMAESFGYIGIDDEIEHNLKKETLAYLKDIDGELAKELSQSSIKIVEEAFLMRKKEGAVKAIKLLEKSINGSSIIWVALGNLYKKIADLHKAEEYYLKAEVQGSRHVFILLGHLYKKQEKYNKAIEYYLKAEVEGSLIVLESLSGMYTHLKQYKEAEEYSFKAEKYRQLQKTNKEKYQNKFKRMRWIFKNNIENKRKMAQDDAIDFSKKYSGSAAKAYLALILLWNEEFEKSYMVFFDWLDYGIKYRREKEFLLYLTLLISKGQFYKAKEFLEIPEYQLKEQYKPIWYALMTLMQDDFPHEVKKMGSELKGTVDEVLEEIERLRVKYAI